MKIGKLVYILTESFAEFALNLKTPQISPLALNDLIEFYSQLCAHMEERSFFTFLQEIYLPPEEVILNLNCLILFVRLLQTKKKKIIGTY